MKKRAISAVLWFYAGWYLGALIAQFLGLTPALGPILGAAAAAIFAGDPRGIIWKTAAREPDGRVQPVGAVLQTDQPA